MIGGRPYRLLVLAAIAVATVGGACERHIATAHDCRAILDRLVALELTESGYRDGATTPRWQAELAQRFRADLNRCQALRVHDRLDGCLAPAKNSEEVVHRCLD